MSRSISLQVTQGPVSKNACGECTACCDILAVAELGKPFYSRCEHLILNKGCEIYAERPQGCACFRCAWHAGVLGDSIDRRPDRCGLMFDLNPADIPPRLNVWEVIPGALAKANLQYLIKKVREHKLMRGIRLGRPAVVLYRFGSKLGLPVPIAEEYADWKPPASPTMRFLPGPPGQPDQAFFNGEIEPLRMPKNSSPPATASDESPGKKG